MRTVPVCLASLALLVVGILAGCSQTPTQSPDVSDALRKSLDQAGLKDVSVAQDREKGVVTLAGHVAAEGEKSQAESIAKSIAGGQVWRTDCRGSDGRRKPVQDGERRSGQRHREEPGCCTYTEQASQQRKVRGQERCCHAEWRGQHSSSARDGRKDRVSSSKREAGGERVAGEEPEGHVVKVTLSSVHLLNVSLHNSVAS